MAEKKETRAEWAARQGLVLTLALAEDTVRQRDVEKMLAALGKLGASPNDREANRKTVLAALQSGWLADLKVGDRAIGADDLADLHPAHVRYFAQEIDRFYNRVTDVPLA